MIGWAAATGVASPWSRSSCSSSSSSGRRRISGRCRSTAREDYARAGIPMLPVVAGATETRRQILLYTLILAPLGVAPWLLGYAGLDLWHRRAGNRRHHDRAGVARARRAARAIRRANNCSPSRSSICSCCSPCSSSIGCREGFRAHSHDDSGCNHERHAEAGRQASGLPSNSFGHAGSRSIAIALALGAFVVVIFLVTLVRLGGNVLTRPM